MRLALRGDSLLERLAIGLRLVPRPALEAWGGSALSGVLVAAVRLGMTAELAARPAGAAELADRLGLDAGVTRKLLDCLTAAGHLRYRTGRYALTRSARRWLDPASPLSMVNFVVATADYGPWWAGLAEVARTGAPQRHHDTDPDDAYWDRYIRGQLDLARLSADEVASRIPVPAGAHRLLDIGGGHGWYAAALCRRHPALSATVLDLPGSARVGERIVDAAGLSPRIAFRRADAATAELEPGQHVVLCFNLVHHLAEPAISDLFRRVHAALEPGGCFAVLDAFATPSGRPNPATAFVDLFMYLSSGARLYRPDQAERWLREAGFTGGRRTAIRRLPGLSLYLARRP